MSSAVPRLVQLLSPVVHAVGCDLEEFTVSPAGRRQVVRMLVDRDGGVDLDGVAEVSRVVSEALDDIDAREPALLAGAYVLEVSSPGVDRPLTEPRHWRRNTGRLVTAHLRDGGSRSGRLVETGQTYVLIDGQRLELAQVARGQVQVEFRRTDASPAAGDIEDEDDRVGDDRVEVEEDA